MTKGELVNYWRKLSKNYLFNESWKKWFKNKKFHDFFLKKQEAPKEIPIVGYTGFQKSIKSENLFGKTFKDLSNLSNKSWIW